MVINFYQMKPEERLYVYQQSAQIDLLKEKLYKGTATHADITRVTRRLGDEIAKVYGFSIPYQRKAASLAR